MRLHFAETLLYLVLPDLRRFSHAAPVAPVDALARFMTFINREGVETIMELSISDDHLYPLAESFVVNNILMQFRVYKLNWRKLDLSLRFLTSSQQVLQT